MGLVMEENFACESVKSMPSFLNIAANSFSAYFFSRTAPGYLVPSILLFLLISEDGNVLACFQLKEHYSLDFVFMH